MADSREISERILAENSEDFTTLVKIAGLNPKIHFRFMNLEGVDFSGQDLSGFDFTGSILKNCNFEGALTLYAKFGENDVEVQQDKAGLVKFLNSIALDIATLTDRKINKRLMNDEVSLTAEYSELEYKFLALVSIKERVPNKRKFTIKSLHGMLNSSMPYQQKLRLIFWADIFGVSLNSSTFNTLASGNLPIGELRKLEQEFKDRKVDLEPSSLNLILGDIATYKDADTFIRRNRLSANSSSHAVAKLIRRIGDFESAIEYASSWAEIGAISKTDPSIHNALIGISSSDQQRDIVFQKLELDRRAVLELLDYLLYRSSDFSQFLNELEFSMRHIDGDVILFQKHFRRNIDMFQVDENCADFADVLNRSDQDMSRVALLLFENLEDKARAQYINRKLRFPVRNVPS